MTSSLDGKPVNGHATPLDIDRLNNHQPAEDTGQQQSPTDSVRVTQLRSQLHNLTAERDLLTEIAEVDGDPVLVEVRSEQERDADRQVAEKVRTKQRTDRLRAGRAQVRHDRRARRHSQWDQRAERARARILDPARALTSDYRRWVATAAALFALVAAGIAFMAISVHHGVVGVHGPWFGYLIEPLASVLLATSLAAQFTARQRGATVPRSFMAFDAAIAASVLLNVVPYGVRYGWETTSLLPHLLAPLLVTSAVVGWHLASGMFATVLASSKDNPVERERLALLRNAIAAGELDPHPSATQVIKHLRGHIPTGISQQDGRRIARLLLGY